MEIDPTNKWAIEKGTELLELARQAGAIPNENSVDRDDEPPPEEDDLGGDLGL